MQYIEISGLYTYYDNIKKLKLDDKIILKENKNNKITKDAIGAYTINNIKIGYIPYTIKQIDINNNYFVSKIKLNTIKPLLFISCKYDNSNMISIEPNIIKNIKYNYIKKLNKTPYNDDLEKFKHELVKNNINNDINIIYYDENYINLLINNQIFYTITKKFYEENIFKYEEFNKYKIIPINIFKLFKIHRLEIYITKYYNNINNIIKKYKNKIINIIKTNNIDFNNLYETITLDKINFNYNIDIIKLIIKYKINNNYILNNDILCFNFIYKINFSNYNISLNNIFNNLNVGDICYNHKIKGFCNIDLYNNDNIIILINDNININIDYIIYLTCILLISNKKYINIYNPINGIIYKFNLLYIINLLTI